MNFVDLGIILLVIVTLIRGAEIGLVRQISSLVGLVAGIVIGSLISSWINADPLFSLALIIFAVIGAIAAAEYGGIRLKVLLHEKKINKLDRILGSVVGVVICLMLVWFGSTLVSAIPSPGLQQGVRDSRVIVWLDSKLPPATAIMQWFEQSLAQTKIPEIVRELEPKLPDTNAKLPDLGSLNAVVTSARPSVVEIEGRSCFGIGVGSGFVADDGIVITNAHVVAGMRHPYVQDANGRHAAEIIGFDADLDIAVLRTNSLAGAPLTIIDNTVANGTQGVVLGYPGGGPFTASPAAVIERFTALGKDIYNEQTGRRDVYALKANVREGNSGGPLLDTNGDVIGVIFARSTSYEQVGYALTTPNVIQTLNAAKQSPSSAGSTRCSAE